jgi:hypothetical protein
VAVFREFEVNTHQVKTMALLNLRQTCFVEDYKQQFDQLFTIFGRMIIAVVRSC